MNTKGLTQLSPDTYEAPDSASTHVIERTHGERNVGHLTDKPVDNVNDMLDWVMKFSEHKKAAQSVGGHVKAMQHLYKLTGQDLDDAQEFLAPVKGAKNMTTKAFIPEGVWATILHFDKNILREGRIDEILACRPEWCAPWYKPKRGGKRWALHSLLPRRLPGLGLQG